MNALVSIIIPAFNAAPWVADTLQSVLDQTHSRCEIIVIDDGSADDTLEQARKFEPRGVRVLSQPNQGAAAARNSGLRHATGDYIQFLDADDLLASHKIERQLLLANQAGNQCAICGTWGRFQRTTADASFSPEPLCMDAPPVDWMVVKFEQHAMMHPAAWLVSRELVKKAGFWDETLSLDDDGDFFSRVVLASESVRFCHEAVSYYRSGLSSSLSRSRSDSAWESAFRSLELSSRRLLQAEDSPRTRKACATAYQRYVYEAYPRAKDCRRRAAEAVTSLGGSTLKLEGGKKFSLVRKVLGWRLAKRLHLCLR